jgi:small subunit ribosomal protein S1
MPNRDILGEIGLSREDLEKHVTEAMGDQEEMALNKMYEESIKNFEVDTILKGRIINMIGSEIIVDVGYKSEGIIPMSEFSSPHDVRIGDAIEVFLEAVEDQSGLIAISKVKADRIRGWERIMTNNHEGDVVRGRVIRKIKGGLLVDIGVPVFLPASQVDIRKVDDIGTYLGRDVECKIIKIDEKRMNIIVSRRRLLEEQREEMKRKLLEELKDGDVRTGIVKNIADFGAFVDLGGVDGLLHITDMSWGRVSHPSEIVALDQTLQIKVLRIDRKTERIALGLKQLSENPWTHVEKKYSVGSKVKGRVVNILPYGAFVELETGVEGLVHVSEMSWTKRINHPSEVVAIGDVVEVVVLNINREKQEISLGMKQTEVNPWTLVEQKYPPGTKIQGRVRNMTNYGAFVEIEEGIDGLLHVSDISWTKKVMHPSEILKKGDKIEAIVLAVDAEKKKVSLGLKQLSANPWDTYIPDKYKTTNIVQGKVTKLTSFGAFVELEPNLEGLVHISKLSDREVTTPDKIVSVGDVVEVEVIRLEPNEGKIGLSLIRIVESKKKAGGKKEDGTAETAAAPTDAPAATLAPVVPAAPEQTPPAPVQPPPPVATDDARPAATA